MLLFVVGSITVNGPGGGELVRTYLVRVFHPERRSSERAAFNHAWQWEWSILKDEYSRTRPPAGNKEEGMRPSIL